MSFFLGPLTDTLTRVIIARHEVDQASSDRALGLSDFQQAMDEAGVRLRAVGPEWMTPFHVNDRQAQHYRSGNICLAGHASHIHSPLGGQGMNTSIQDAANLCWKLAAVARGSRDAEKLLNSYEEERSAVGRALLHFTERGLKLTTAANPMLVKLRDALLPHLSSMTSVQKSIADFVSETDIEYPSSSIVQDHGSDGELRAGDRMPDLDLRNQMGDHTTLLGDWTGARHLAIVVNATEEFEAEIASSLGRAQVVAILDKHLDPEGQRLVGQQPKLIIVRAVGSKSRSPLPIPTGPSSIKSRM
jgi:hypothetical protein